MSDIPNKTKCVDDTLLWSNNIEESFYQAAQWLDRCGRNGITLNPSKFTFAAEVVEFAGFEITNDSVRPCSKYLDTISDFPVPRNITDIRSWFGLINQVSYAFASADVMSPFRHLLKPDTPFNWTPQLQTLFDKSKQVIVDEIKEGVSIFDPTRPTCLATDYSKEGIGFWLSQKHCNCPTDKPFCCKIGWKITLAGSRFTHAAESRYAPIEGEALAVAEALEKSRYFVLGCKYLTVAVDHKPLLKILGDRHLEDIPNSRLRNLKEKTLRFRFKVVHIPGIKHCAADCLSRYPCGKPEKFYLSDDDAGSRTEEPVEHQIAVTNSLLQKVKCVTWERVKHATASDPTFNQLLQMIEQDCMPEFREELPVGIRDFHKLRPALCTADGVIIYRDCTAIPPSLRQDVLY